jgi:hypothetical protein
VLPVVPLIESSVVEVNVTVPLRLGDVRDLLERVSVAEDEPRNCIALEESLKYSLPSA